MAIKEIFESNTDKIDLATELLKVLSDREGKYVWKKLTTEGGEFVDFVVADVEDAYPDGGTKDGFWFELVKEGIGAENFGFTKIAVDTFVPTSRTYWADGVTVPHSLEVKPVMAIFYKVKKPTNGTDFTFAIFNTNWNSLNASSGNIGAYNCFQKTNSEGRPYAISINSQATPTATSITYKIISYPEVGVEYKLVTMA